LTIDILIFNTYGWD